MCIRDRYDSGRDLWAPELLAQRSELTMEQCTGYLENLYRIEPRADFVYSVSRDVVETCSTPILVMPDNTPSHSYEAAIEVANLAPKAQITVYPWKEEEGIKAETINQVRQFLSNNQS